MKSWERFDEKLLPRKAFKTFNNKNKVEYHDLYVQSDTLLLSDVFENFRNKFIEISEVNPAHFLSAPELAWEACLKMTEIALVVEKGNQRRNVSCNT